MSGKSVRLVIKATGIDANSTVRTAGSSGSTDEGPNAIEMPQPILAIQSRVSPLHGAFWGACCFIISAHSGDMADIAVDVEAVADEGPIANAASCPSNPMMAPNTNKRRSNEDTAPDCALADPRSSWLMALPEFYRRAKSAEHCVRNRRRITA